MVKSRRRFESVKTLENGFTRTSAYNFCVRFCQLSADSYDSPHTNMGTLLQLNIQGYKAGRESKKKGTLFSAFHVLRLTF